MIATFTDFGAQGPYLGQVRRVLAQQAPDVPVVDVFVDLPAFDPRAAAYLLPAYSVGLAAGDICLCVVDPGVGTSRRALMVQADDRWYVGPDNGLLSQVVRRAARVAAFSIDWRPEALSDSFHARDLFAPVCAMLAKGRRPRASALDRRSLDRPEWPDDLAEIVYIDPYGNAISGLRATAVAPESQIEVSGCRCQYRRTFAEAAASTPFWYVNANGLVEIAVNAGRVADRLSLDIGRPLFVMHSS